ncbi:T6SS immunity protein Tli4 family protein [Variovorax brevis]|uniref:T6SS immunity protein Tli4 family protein n=1 Tax=Variovorax brevis TaxID=3053503 RepID=UPI00257628BF|nr:T6SS immunity protein Tli4 family protein [Variovorax sp. J22R133]
MLLAASALACTAVASSTYTLTTMNPIASERQTHCMGRYLIDLPKGFSLQTGGWGNIELYYGLDKNFKRVYATVRSELYTPDAFVKAVRARRDELQGAVNEEAKGPMLLKTEQLGEYAVMLRRHDKELYEGAIRSEVHQLVGQRYVIFDEKSYVPESMALGDTPNKYTHVNTGPTEERLRMISKRLLPYIDATGAPAGFCQQGVVFNVGQDDEVSSFRFFDESRPDVHVEVDYHAVTGQPGEPLFDRGSAVADQRILALFNKAGGVTLRKRETMLGGMPAQELLDKLSRPIVQHLFNIETRTAKQSLQQPTLSLKILTGQTNGVPQDKQTSSSLSDDQVIQLWDGIVRSVRPRTPVSVSTSLSCRPGEPCPLSGIWKAVAASHTPMDFQWMHQGRDRGVVAVRQGESMPAIPRASTQEQGSWEWQLASASGGRQ